MKILMTGATGEFAGMILPELLSRGITIRALVRDEQKASVARERGAQEIAIGDLDDAESLKDAAQGIDGVFHLNPGFAPNEDKQGIAMVDAAIAAGAQKFVFSGVYHPSLSLINHAAKRPVEKALYYSDLKFVILQPAMFMQNLLAGWPIIKETGKFALPYNKQSAMSYIDYRDVAEAVALAFTTDRLDYGTFDLSAPGMFSRAEIAGLMSEGLGRTVEALDVDFEAWANMAQMPGGPIRDGLKAMYENYDRHGFHGGNGLVLEAILGRPPRTLPHFIQELINAG